MAQTKRQKAKAEYRKKYGSEPSTSALNAFLYTLPDSTFVGCSDYSSSSYSSSYDSGSSYSSYDSGSSFSDGGSCSI